MLKVISLSLFGYNNNHSECHTFDSFIRFLSINLRAAKTIFNDWKIEILGTVTNLLQELNEAEQSVMSSVQKIRGGNCVDMKEERKQREILT